MMDLLTSPIELGTLTLKNRFMRSATQDRMGNNDGSITGKEIQLLETLAANDVGLIVSGCCYVSQPHGRHGARQNALYHDRFIAGFQAIASAVHKHGAKFIVQLSHAGRQTTPEMIGGNTPKAPSAALNAAAGMVAEALSESEIGDIIRDFANAAARAKAAGCDGVQLHIAHGYLLSQFLSPYTNKRQDRWGGSIENRTRILREIVQQTKTRVGEAFPILAKLNSTDGFEGPGYLSLPDVIWTAKLLESVGVAGIEISGGIQESKDVIACPGIRNPDQEGCFVEAARSVKQAVGIPVILVGGLRSLASMEEVIQASAADLVSLSRPFICEPDLLKRFAAGQAKASCISCNRCFGTDELQCHYIH